jgi:hypothetical protein
MSLKRKLVFSSRRPELARLTGDSTLLGVTLANLGARIGTLATPIPPFWAVRCVWCLYNVGFVNSLRYNFIGFSPYRKSRL